MPVWSASKKPEHTSKQTNEYWLIWVKNFYLPVADVNTAKAFKAPGNLMELHTYVSYMKDKSGIHGWTEQQHLLQVRLFICLSLVTTNVSYNNLSFCSIAVIIAI